MKNFNLPQMAGCKQCRKFVRDNFLIEVLDGAARNNAQLDLLVINKGELFGYVIITDNLGCSDHEIIYNRISRGSTEESQHVDPGFQACSVWRRGGFWGSNRRSSHLPHQYLVGGYWELKHKLFGGSMRDNGHKLKEEMFRLEIRWNIFFIRGEKS